MRPTTLPQWATDDVYDATGTGWDGIDPKLEPPAGLIEEGWEPGQAPNARHLNWILNLLCRWIAYVEPGVLNGWQDLSEGNAGSVWAHRWQVVLPPRPNNPQGAWCFAGGDGTDAKIVATRTGLVQTDESFPAGPTTRFLAGILHTWDGNTYRYVLGSESGHIVTATDPDGTWTLRTSGVEGANAIRAFAQNADGSVLVAITNHTGADGILRSTDHGATWSSVNPGAGAAGVDIVWTGDRFLATYTGGATRRSTDGATWSAGTSAPVATATALATDGDGTVVAYPTGSGVSYYVSDDHGVSWGAAQALSAENGGGSISGDRGRMIYHQGLWLMPFGGSIGFVSSPTALAGSWRAHIVDHHADLAAGQFYSIAYGHGRYMMAGGRSGPTEGWIARTPCFAGGRRGFPEAS